MGWGKNKQAMQLTSSFYLLLSIVTKFLVVAHPLRYKETSFPPPPPPPFFLLALFFGVEHSQSHTHTGKSFLDNYSLPVTLLEYRLAWRTHKTHSLLPGRMSRQMHHHHHHHHYYLSISSAPTYRKPGKDKSLRKENTTRQKWLPTLVS